MRPVQRGWSGLAGMLLACAVHAGSIGHDSSIDGRGPLGSGLPIDDATLDEIRGGFTTTSGLEVSFGIERVLYINGTLISTTSLNVADLSKSSPVQLSSTTSAQNAQSTQGIPTTQSTPSPQSTPGPQSTPAPNQLVDAVVPPIAPTSTGAGPGSGAPASPVPTTVQQVVDNSAPSLALIQSGSGNVVHADTLPPASMATVVQNTLNDQKIQNVTVINATVNSMEVLKTLDLQSAISNAIHDSVRK